MAVARGVPAPEPPSQNGTSKNRSPKASCVRPSSCHAQALERALRRWKEMRGELEDERALCKRSCRASSVGTRNLAPISDSLTHH